MNKQELEKVLELHRRAYAALLWIGRQAQQHPQSVSAEVTEELRKAADCERWTKRHRCDLPANVQPAEADVSAFARLLTSFFQTSFHMEQTSGEDWQGVELVRGVRDTSLKRKAKKRERKTVKDLEIIAIKALLEDVRIELPHEAIIELIDDRAVASDLALWSYACELQRRCHFASQGPAVHRMWLDMSQDQRKKLTADVIWHARERLIEVLAARASVNESE